MTKRDAQCGKDVFTLYEELKGVAMD